MAAVTLKEGSEFDCVTTFNVLANYLPMYARPRFIRLQVRSQVKSLTDFLPSGLSSAQVDVFQNSLEMTGTFKMMKVKLVEEGFNPAQIQDLLYFLDLTQKKYIPLTQEVFNSIMSQDIKL